MAKRVIYPRLDGGVAVLIPAANIYTDGQGHWWSKQTPSDALPEGFHQAAIEEIARKDVPAGTPYEIIDEADLPDRMQRNAWEWV